MFEIWVSSIKSFQLCAHLKSILLLVFRQQMRNNLVAIQCIPRSSVKIRWQVFNNNLKLHRDHWWFFDNLQILSIHTSNDYIFFLKMAVLKVHHLQLSFSPLWIVWTIQRFPFYSLHLFQKLVSKFHEFLLPFSQV